MVHATVASVFFSLLLSTRLVVSASSAAASGRAGLERLRHGHAGASMIATMEFKHTLRVCNAYAYAQPMDVYLGKEKIANAMPYKSCGEFAPHLKEGDKVEFKVVDSTEAAGTFSVSELPASDAVLVLVMYRHDRMSTAVSFASHIFSNTLSPQLAVLDTYRGGSDAKMHVQDLRAKEGEEQRSEELRYNSVVAVNPGKYEVVMKGTDGKVVAKREFVALPSETYVAVRCGVQAEIGKAYPEDIIVFPRSDPKMLSGAASSKHSLLILAVVSLLSVSTMLLGE